MSMTAPSIAKASDFNDLKVIRGTGAVREAVDAAQPAEWHEPDHALNDDKATGPDALNPPTMAPEGFPPLLRELTAAACASSEAHPVAVAANAIAWFGAAVGRGAFQRVGDAIIHMRPYFLIVGKSGKARKGTAEVTVRKVFALQDTMTRERRGTKDTLRFHTGGLSTGEGLAYAIRDPKEADEKGKGGDDGVRDKRLVVGEPEFANVLAQVKREGNTLSSTVRNAWDGRDLEPLTKTSQTRVTAPHIVIVGHITGFELREKSTENDAANGLLNRFMLVYVYRPKLVPLPQPTPEPVLQRLAQKLADAIEFATSKGVHAENQLEVTLSPEAAELWCRRYAEVTRDRDGKAGSLLARSEVYARMLAGIFALMDRRAEIEPCDLTAALAWVDYWHASVSYVFQVEDQELDELPPFPREVLSVIEARPGITQTELQRHWNNGRSAELKAALERLTGAAPPLVEAKKEKYDGTGGRRPVRYFARARTNWHEPDGSPWMMEETTGVRSSAGRGRSNL